MPPSLEESLDNLETSSEVRFKLFRGKQVPLCDYQGTCENKAYAEVYPDLLREELEMIKRERKTLGWSYRCKPHFRHEQEEFRKLGEKLPYERVE